MTALAQPLVIFVLTALAAAGMLWSVFQPRLDGSNRASDRLAAVSQGRAPALPGAIHQAGRKQSVEDALRELAEQETGADGKRRKMSLAKRLRQAGLMWSRRTFYIFGVAVGLLSYLGATTLAGIGPVPAAGFGVAATLLIPNIYVNRKRKKRMDRFTEGLPDALDVIVRGVKSGLPLSDCLKTVAADAAEPVRSEFKAIVEDNAMGMSLAEAVARLPERIPLSEATFFSIVIAIQSRSGGSLSEALGNLAKVVRERKKMKGKIQAMSSEAKTSAMIIGSMPFCVAGALAGLAPDYVGLLFTDIIGNVILVASALWMLIGVLVMRKMIAFDF